MIEESVPHEEASRAGAAPPRASRVLVVTTRWDLVGGSERYAGDVVRALHERGHSVPVLCAEGAQAGADEVHRFEALAAERLSRVERHALRDLVRGLRPDVIYLLSRAREDALRVLLDAAPVVRFVQDHTLFCPGLNKLHEDGTPCESPLGLACLERYYTGGGCSGFKATGPPSLRWPHSTLATHLRELELTKRCRRVLVASHYMRGELLRAGLPASLVEVLPYFTSPRRPTPEPLDAATRAFLDADERPLLFTPARLVLPDKGLDYLLTALGHLDGRAKLVIAGDGPARAWLEQKAADEGLTPHVHFSGWLAPGPLETLYAACDVVIFPSVWNEPFGLVGLEARAHGKPVVAFDVGGVREWHDRELDGPAVPRGDALALAQSVEERLRKPRKGLEPAPAATTLERHVGALAALLQA